MEKIILYIFGFTAAICLFIFSNSFLTPYSYSFETFSLNKINENLNSANISKPLILEWNGYWQDVPYESYSCAEKCIFTKNKSLEKDATLITFHYPRMNLSNLPKTSNRNRMNVFVSLESPANYPYPRQLPNNFFNATISYMLNSDYPMLYNCFKKLDGDGNTDKWSDKEVEKILSKKTEPIVTFVSNCMTSSKRESLIPILEKQISLTKFGFCFKNRCQRDTKCEKDLQEKHYFVLALENSHCADYFTEKVWRLRNLIVPIIMDRSLLKSELAYLNPYVIALSDFKSVKGFVEYLKYLINNNQEYKKYFEWTKLYKKSDGCALLDDLPCQLCDLAMKVQSGFRKEMNVKKWWQEGTCKSSFVQSWLQSGSNK